MSEQLNSWESLLVQVLAEQVKQTALLKRMTEQQLMLIQALAEDEPEDSAAQSLTYMDGSPCR